MKSVAVRRLLQKEFLSEKAANRDSVTVASDKVGWHPVCFRQGCMRGLAWLDMSCGCRWIRLDRRYLEGRAGLSLTAVTQNEGSAAAHEIAFPAERGEDL